MAIVKKKGRRFLYTKFTQCGVRVDESTKTNSRVEAQEYEDKRRSEIRRVVMLGHKPSMTWLNAERRWLEEKKTKRSICDDIRIFQWLQPHLQNMTLSEITKDVIEGIAKKKEETGVKPATVNRVLSLISSVLNRACKDWELIDRVPKITKRVENNERIRWLKYEEAQRLLSVIPEESDHLKDKIKFTLATGLREYNVSFLEWTEVDLINKRLSIPGSKMKGKRDHHVPLNKDAINIIKKQIGNHPTYVFVYGGQPTKKCSTKAWYKALKRAGITDFHWHDLRHTFFSWLAQNGATLQELMELGPWRDVKTALRYAHLSPTHLQSVVDRVTGAKLGTVNLRVVGGGT